MKYIVALSAAASLASAQMMNVMSAAAPAPGMQTHTVIVGGLKPVATGMAPILGYQPEAITAAVGDTVEFVFMQKNHTVTQSTFAAPCNKMDGGLDSGFMPNPEGKAGVTFNMTVSTLEAQWFYCKQRTGTHCGVGMIFSINADGAGAKTHAAFKQLAINVNGTDTLSFIQNVQPNAAAVPDVVTIQAGAALGTPVGTAPLPPATLAAGEGVNAQGQACTCSCLCGVNDFPAAAGVNSFGGFAGTLG